MVVVVVTIMAAIVGIAAWTAVRFRETIAPVFRPSVRAWRLLRGIMLILASWGLWLSERGSLQAIAVVIWILAGFYLALEVPQVRQYLTRTSV